MDKAPDLNKYDSLMSQTMDYLRFPLIIGVIFIHAFTLGEINSTPENYRGYYYLSQLFSQVLGRLAVPLFFFISGYLFFFKVEGFSSSIYIIKLRKRIKTLLIPYLFWNILVFLFFYVLNNLSITTNYVNGGVQNKLNMNFVLVLIGVLDGKWSMPWAYQFWFIRDLFICVIVSPILYWLITRFNYLFILVLGIIWFTGYVIPSYEIGFVSVFFFSFGALLSLKRINLIILSREIKVIGLLYPVLLIADLLTKKCMFNFYIHNTAILSGIIMSFLIVSYFIEHRKIKPVPFLSASSFFIFALHEPLLTIIEKLISILFNLNCDYKMCIAYISCVVIVAIISTMVYYMLDRYMPKFNSFITGGR